MVSASRRSTCTVLGVLCFLGMMGAGREARAQAPAVGTPPAASPAPSSPPGGVVVFTTPGQVQEIPGATESKGVPPRLKFFLDARYLDRFLETKGRMVFLRHADYEDLLARKKQIEEKLAKEQRLAPPHDAALASARFDVTVAEDTATIRATFKGKLESHGPAGEGWKALPLVGGRVAVHDFKATFPGALLALRDTLAGQNLRLPGGEGFFYVLAKGEGDGEVTLELAAPVTDDGALRKFTIALPDCPMMSMGITLKESGLKVMVEPGVGSRTSTGGGAPGMHVEVGLRPGQPVSVSWQRKVAPPTTPTVTASPPPPRLKLHPKLSVDRAMALYCVGEDSVTQVDRVDLNVSLAPVEQLKFLKDAELDVTQLEGPAVTGVPQRVDDGKALLVHLSSPLQGHTTVDAVGDKPLKERAAELTLRPLALDGAERLREGFLAITSDVPLGIKPNWQASKDIVSIMPAQLPPELTQGLDKPILMAFRQRSPDAVLALDLTRFGSVHVPSATITSLDARTSLPEPGPGQKMLHTKMRLQVRSSSSSWLKVMFGKPGAEQGQPTPSLDGVFVGGQPGSSTKKPYGYDVQLARSEATPDGRGEVEVKFDILTEVPDPGYAGTYHLELPRLGLPVARATWSVIEPDDYSVVSYHGHLAGVTPPTDLFLDRWVTGIWQWLRGVLVELGLLGLIVGALVLWALAVVLRRTAREEPLPLPHLQMQVPWLMTGGLTLMALFVVMAALNSTGSNVNNLLQKVASSLATVGDYRTDDLERAQEAPREKNGPRMSRDVYAEIFRKQMSDTSSMQAGKKPRTVVDMVRSQGYTMDDWADAGRAYGIPDSVSGKRVMAMGLDKAKAMPRRSRWISTEASTGAAANAPAAAAAPAEPGPESMPSPAPAFASKNGEEAKSEATGDEGATGGGEGEAAGAGGTTPPVSGELRTNPLELTQAGGGSEHTLAREFVYMGDAEGGPQGLWVDVRYVRRSIEMIPRVLAAILGFGLFVVLCLATREHIASGAAILVTLVTLFLIGFIDRNFGDASHAALTAFGVPVLMVAAARLAALGVEWYETEREDALAERLRREDAARAAEHAARATRRTPRATEREADVSVKEIFPEGVDAVTFVEDGGNKSGPGGSSPDGSGDPPGGPSKDGPGSGHGPTEGGETR